MRARGEEVRAAKGRDARARGEAAERWRALRGLERWLERPMMVLGVAWLALLVVELTRGLTPLLEVATTVIWVLFIGDFALRFALAPDRRRYLARNWLTAVSLLVPALRLFRALRPVGLLRAGRGLRSIRLVKVVGSMNRGMRALGRSMRRRRLGYVLALTLVVTFAGAAGMYALEGADGGTAAGFPTYGDALWWTTMILTTLGSEYWPRSPEGRVLCVLLSLYGLAMLGYITASFAALFVGRDAESGAGEVAGAKAVAALQAEVRALRAELRDALRR